MKKISTNPDSPFCCSRILLLGRSVLLAMAMFLPGCTNGGTVSMDTLALDVKKCELGSFHIEDALCTGGFQDRPGTDPHDVIDELASVSDPDDKPGTDPHDVCGARFRKDSYKDSFCDCHVENERLLTRIVYCFTQANGDAAVYGDCLDKVIAYEGLTCLP